MSGQASITDFLKRAAGHECVVSLSTGSEIRGILCTIDVFFNLVLKDGIETANGEKTNTYESVFVRVVNFLMAAEVEEQDPVSSMTFVACVACFPAPLRLIPGMPVNLSKLDDKGVAKQPVCVSMGPTDTDDRSDFFESCLHDQLLTFAPFDLGLPPVDNWASGAVTFGDLVTTFFRRKNNFITRFPRKLVTALKIVEERPNLYPAVGVTWVSETVIKVNKLVFARLLGIKTVDGALFHRHGNFPSHGFVELKMGEVEEGSDLSDVDYDCVRLLRHSSGMFTRSTEEELVHACEYSAEFAWRSGK